MSSGERMHAMGNEQVIAGRLWVNGGDPLPAQLTIEQDVRQEWTGLPKSDPSWMFVDANGHFHAYDLDGGTDHYPTLRRRIETLPCDNADHDHECEGRHVTHWHCQVCDEEVQPGLLPGPHSFLVEGLKDWRIEVDGRVEPAREHAVIRFEPVAGGDEYFGVAVAMASRGWMPEGGSGPRFTTVVRGAGPLGRRAGASRERCICALIDVSTNPADIAFVRGKSNGCSVHPDPRQAEIDEAKRRARQA